MRVGTLTFHRALNYGAVLQAYALQRALDELGCEAEVIDYRCDALTRTYRPFALKSARPRDFISALVYLPMRVARHVRFAAFRRRHLKISATRFTSATITEALGIYDHFVVGSDQVWNPAITDSDTVYFLDFCDDPSRTSAYAASLGKAVPPAPEVERLLMGLERIGSLSVRERDVQEYLGGLLGRQIEWVLDPVFLLSPEAWDGLAQRPGRRKPYIFVFCLHETDLYRYVEYVRGLTGYDVVYVPERLRTRLDGTRLTSASVSRLLGYVRDADIVVTDSFHVLAFSILFRRNFKVQLKRQLSGLNSRVLSLLELLGLSERTIESADYEAGVPQEIDYGQVEDRLSEARRSSIAFLKRSLGLEDDA
jgi:hypothetical protein